jgi:uncharacterized protein (DUF433 family)
MIRFGTLGECAIDVNVAALTEARRSDEWAQVERLAHVPPVGRDGSQPSTWDGVLVSCDTSIVVQTMNWHDRIHSDPNVLAGKAVVRGTRIPVDLILERLGAGESIPALVAAYPRLTPEDVHAALTFAADSLRNEAVFAVPSEAA